MHKYYLRMSGRAIRQVQVHVIAAPTRSVKNASKLYLKEPLKADEAIPSILQPLNTKLKNSLEYVVIDANDSMEDMSRSQRHRCLLKLQRGMPFPIFRYA